MQRVITLFLKIAVFLIPIPILAICIFVLPHLTNLEHSYKPELDYLHYPVLIYLYLAVIPVFFIVYHLFKLLGHIDKNKAFTELSIKVVGNIKRSSVVSIVLYVVALPFFYIIAQAHDAPGIMLIGLVILFIWMVIGSIAVVFQRLLQDGVNKRSENELTV